MDEKQAMEEQANATPIFSVYRRGYDPDQVDRYVADQQRRLDDALHRSSESERKLAAAVGQLRELHRRVAVYESEARNQQPPQLDTLGERVQRILQEAWEGAYNLRQEAEREVNELRERVSRETEELRAQAHADVQELREVASREAAEVVDEATRRALHIRDETERRRQAYLERVERDRERAIGQITYLYDQRQGAIAELARLQATVEATIAEMVHSPLGRPAPGLAGASTRGADPEEPMVLGDALQVEAAAAEGTVRLESGQIDEETLIAASLSEFEAAQETLGPELEGSVEATEAGTLFEEERRPSFFEEEAQAELPTGPMERIDLEPEFGITPTHNRPHGVFDGEQEGWT